MEEKQKTTESDNAPIKGSVSSKKSNMSKKVVIAVIVVALVSAAVATLFYFFTPALKIGKYSYDRKTYNEMIQQAKELGVEKNKARDELKLSLASREAASRLGVEYLDDDQSLTKVAYMKYVDVNESDSPPEPTRYQKELAYPDLIQAGVDTYQKGGSVVATLYYPFGRYIAGYYDGVNVGSDANRDLIGNEAAIKADIVYAKQKAEEALASYKNKSKSVAELVDEAQDDRRLTYGQSTNPSAVYTVAPDNSVITPFVSGGTRVSPPLEVRNVIENSEVGAPSALSREYYDLTYEFSIPEIQDQENKTQVGWFFTVLDKKIAQQPDFQNKYQSIIKELLQ